MHIRCAHAQPISQKQQKFGTLCLTC